MSRIRRSSVSLAGEAYQSLVEKLKYYTAWFQLESGHLDYLKAVFRYRFRREVRFPKTHLKLHGARFAARKDSMDIAHLANLFEPETTRFLLRLKPKRFLDIGAHVGRYSILLAKNGAEVAAFEPGEDNFKQLMLNIELNCLQDRIIALNVGCSDVAEHRHLFVTLSNEGSASFIRKTGAEASEIHALKPLDEAGVDLNAVDVIKVDVEGLELNVLKGAEKLLKSQKPIVVVEIWEAQEEKEISLFLGGMGYSIQKILDSRNYVFVNRGTAGMVAMSRLNGPPP